MYDDIAVNLYSLSLSIALRWRQTAKDLADTCIQNLESDLRGKVYLLMAKI